MSDAAAAHAEWMLTAAREELVRADEKASILLAALGVVVGALVAGLLAGDWDPFTLAPAAAVFWWAGVVLIGAAVWFLASAIYPRVGTGDAARPNLAYFGDAEGLNAEELRDRLESSAREHNAAVVDQFEHISRIVRVTYNAIRNALLCLPVGGALCVLGAVLDAHVLR